MKKDIYIIRNDVNSKVYIGQAVNVQQRFQSHCKPSSATIDHELIAIAIQKYGRQHFFYEVLESQIENYNEREKFWIGHFNSLTPLGYNVLPGGEEPPHLQGTKHPEAKLNDAQVEALTIDLKENNISIHNLVAKYGFTSRTSIHEFNQGKTYHRNMDYPIRQNCIRGVLTEDDINYIIEQLQQTKRTYKDIASEFGLEYRAVSRIDKGLLHHRNNINYPIRSK